MVYLCLESNLGRTEGIRGGEVDVEGEHSSFVSVDLLAVGGGGGSVRRSLRT